LKHRDTEYTIVQGLGHQLWQWSLIIEGMNLSGRAATKSEAIAEAERAIDPDPKVAVRWGPQTWEEMQYSGITYSVDD